MKVHVLALWTAAAFGLAVPAPAKDGRRLFVSVDMEGIGGVVSDEQIGVKGFEYERFRGLMTEETNAVIAAAREAGVTEFVVADSHGSFQNLLVDKLPADVQVVRGTPRPYGMMQGLDASFDGVVFLGYHAGTTSTEGVRAHTFSSARLADVRLNGVSMTEGGWNAAFAAELGVPVVAVSGDEAAVKQVQAQVPGTEGAVVKWPYGFHSARTLSPEASRQVIREAVKRGLARRGQIALARVKTPVSVELRFKSWRPSEVLAWLPLFERVDAHAVRYTARDMAEAFRTLEFVTTYAFDLEP
jgi:D-amino peptidase